MTAGPEEADPVGYLIGEFETIVLHLAREIDRLHGRIRELEAAAAPASSELQEPR